MSQGEQASVFNSTDTGPVIIPPINTDIASRKRARYSVASNMKLVPNPDKILSKAGKTMEAYRDLLYDAHVASCEQSRKAGVLALEWEVAENSAATEIVDFVKKQFEQFDLPRIIGELLDAPMFGYAISEVMWTADRDGHIVAEDLIAKPQEWFRFDEKGKPYFTANNYVEGDTLPERKFIVVQNKPTYLNPYGQSVLSRCYWPITFKKQLMQHMMVFAEKYGMPYLIAYFDAIMSGKDAATKLVAELEALHADGVAAIPLPSKAEILDTAKQASIDVFMSGIVFFNAEVSKAILSQTLTTEQGATGSYAMSQTHLMVRKDVVDADVRLVVRALNGFIRWLVDINWMDVDVYPMFRLFEQTDVDQALADRDVKLATGLRVRFGKSYIANAHNIPEDGFEIAEEEAAPAGGGAFASPRRRLLADGDKVTPLQVDGTRQLSESVATELGTPGDETIDALNAMLKPIIQKINSGRSYEEIRETLAEIFPEMTSEQMESTLANSMFVADLVGRVSTR